MNTMHDLDQDSRLLLSLVVPMYNEAAVCGSFFARTLPILANLTDRFEIICVNDGSTDDTEAVLSSFASKDERIKVLNLSRNFGKEMALSAGIEHASGDAIIPIDADLQDPPELIPKMVERWKEGFDSVIAVRSDRASDTVIKRTTANLFYRVVGRLSDVPIPANAGDFRLLDRVVVEALKRLPERNRFMKGLYAWVGFRQTSISYRREQRVAGKTKWRYWGLWNFALDGMLSFSTLPLRIWTYLGVAVSLFAGGYGLFIVARTLLHGVDVPGYASLLVTVLFLGGINMIGQGVLGEYVGRIFLEVKDRPRYLVASSIGLEPKSPQDPR